ncbi:MAG: hypothetical protein WCK51_10220 [Armatimonadota bacterium]
MRKLLALSFLALSIQAAQSQAPDVRIKGDVSLSYINNEGAGLRTISPLNRYSTISLSTLSPLGFNILLSQRFSFIQDDADNEFFDEYYVEDSGSWRVGKQYLPFGGGQIMRETALAARIDSNLIFEGLPLSLALVDAGKGRQAGVIGRLGGRGYGFSAALGDHWGINGTALNLFQSLGPGMGRESGYQQAFGFDWNQRAGRLTTRYESVALRRPNQASDELNLTDLSFTYDLGGRNQLLFGVSDGRDRWLRFGGTYNAKHGVTIEVLSRAQNGKIVESSLTFRIKF